MKIEVTEALMTELHAHAKAASENTAPPDANKLKLRAVIVGAQIVHKKQVLHIYTTDGETFRAEFADGSSEMFSPTFGQVPSVRDDAGYAEEPIEIESAEGLSNPTEDTLTSIESEEAQT